MSRIVRNALSLGSALLLAASLGATAFAADPTNVQTASNTAAATQSGAAVSGSATAAGTGSPLATSGDATVTLVGAQSQSNVQLAGAATVGVASSSTPTTITVTTTQAATNTAALTQTGVAVSGPAAAANGATARSGDATVFVFGEQAQKNTQVAADLGLAAFSSGNAAVAPITIVQTADNTAVLQQTAGAVSGGAAATGALAKARSGDVSATDAALQEQENEQVALNVAVALAGIGASAVADSAAVQTATNQASILQSAAAVSGSATAAGTGAWAWTGDADALELAAQAQENEQDVANIAFAFGPHALVLAAITSDQTALNTAVIEQAAAASSGDATATGTVAWAFSGDAAVEVAADQAQRLEQMFLNVGFGAGTVVPIVGNTQTADQLAVVVPQAAAAASGPAATVGSGTTITGDVLTAEAMCQLQEGFEGAIYINGALLP